MRPALILAALSALALYACTPAHAGEPCTVIMERCEGDCVARVTVQNNPVLGLPPYETVLALDGLLVGLTFETRPGGSSDVARLVPPAGYSAEPAVLEVPEGGVAVALIRMAPLS